MEINRTFLVATIILFIIGFVTWFRIMAVSIESLDYLSLNMGSFENYFYLKMLFSSVLGVTPWLVFIILLWSKQSRSFIKTTLITTSLILAGIIFYFFRLMYIKTTFISNEANSDILFYYDYSDFRFEYWFAYGVLFSWASFVLFNFLSSYFKKSRL